MRRFHFKIFSAIFFTTFFLALSCGPNLFTQEDGSDPFVAVAVLENSNGVITASVAAGAEATITANADGEIDAASVFFPAGTLAVPSDITLEQGASIVSSSMAESLSIGGNVSVGGPAVLISSSAKQNPANPYTITLPLSVSALQLSQSHYAVFYQAYDYSAGERVVAGVIPTSQLKLYSDRIEASAKYFGSFQVVVSDAEISEANEVESETVIVSAKQQQTLTPLLLSEIAVSVNNSTRKASFQISIAAGSAALQSCYIIVDRDKIKPWDYSSTSTTGLVDVDAVVSDAHHLYAYYECRAASGQTANSAWSVAASFTAVTTQNDTTPTAPTALSSFVNNPVNARRTLELQWTYPANVSGYAQLTIEETAGSTAAACGSGTTIKTISNGFTASATDSYIHTTTNYASYSYRACITGSNGAVQSSNTITNITGQPWHYMFVTSETFDGDLSAVYQGMSFSDGLEGADFRCQYLAVQVGLGENWKAIVSGSGTGQSAADRIGNPETHVYNLNSSPELMVSAASSPSTFWQLSAAADTGCSASTNFFLNYDPTHEDGSTLSSYLVWMGTDKTGALDSTPRNCSDWTTNVAGGANDTVKGAQGSAACSGTSWAGGYGSDNCDVQKRLYCISP